MLQERKESEIQQSLFSIDFQKIIPPLERIPDGVRKPGKKTWYKFNEKNSKTVIVAMKNEIVNETKWNYSPFQLYFGCFFALSSHNIAFFSIRGGSKDNSCIVLFLIERSCVVFDVFIHGIWLNFPRMRAESTASAIAQSYTQGNDEKINTTFLLWCSIFRFFRQSMTGLQ